MQCKLGICGVYLHRAVYYTPGLYLSVTYVHTHSRAFRPVVLQYSPVHTHPYPCLAFGRLRTGIHMVPFVTVLSRCALLVIVR